MLNSKMTLLGSSLSLLKVGEEGKILRVKTPEKLSSQDLTKMGLIPGASIKLKQRSPSFIVKTGNTHLTIDKHIANAVYVRLAH
jgi:ferrous iron transport protein A